MHLNDVPIDIVCEIFALCDIYTVLWLSAVSKEFRRLARSKQLWIVLVRDLEYHGMLDVSPDEDLARFTTSELIAKVKYIVDAPKSWAQGKHPKLKKPAISIPLQIPSIIGNEHGLMPVSLPSGGRFLAFRPYLRGPLGLVDVSTGHCFWKSPDTGLFLTSIWTSGGTATIAVASTAFDQTELKIWRYSDRTRVVTEVSVALLPVIMHADSSLLLFENYAVFRIQAKELEIAIVNHACRTVAFLQRPSTRLHDYHVFGDYIAIASSCSRFLLLEASLTLEIYSLSSLESYSIDDDLRPCMVPRLPAFTHTLSTPFLSKLAISQMLCAYYSFIGKQAIPTKMALPWSFRYTFAPYAAPNANGVNQRAMRLSEPTARWIGDVLTSRISFSGYSVVQGRVVDMRVAPGDGIKSLSGLRRIAEDRAWDFGFKTCAYAVPTPLSSCDALSSANGYKSRTSKASSGINSFPLNLPLLLPNTISMPVRVTSSCGSRPSHEKRKHVMSAEDCALAKEKRERNKALNDVRQLWDATLPDAWVPGSTRFRHQNGTAVMFKSDAKKSFGLTEREILTLPHESIPGSLKTYFDLSAVRALHHRKFEAGALFEEIDHRFTCIRVTLGHYRTP
ncbi:hypothetical protein C8F01DRAFT_1369684 [Mycena amicta]|nr:hypothetical protein C8F01DRAFT_1369684 [Mycena amicta]